MGRLVARRGDAALAAIGAIGRATRDDATFARAGVRELAGLIGADLTTLSICALDSGKRHVVGFPEYALSAADIACFDRFFHAHPLVRFHTTRATGGTHRISDSLPPPAFHRSALYAEYYRRIGIEHAAAMPLLVERGLLVSFVLNRSGADFSGDDIATLEAVRPALAAMHRELHHAALERARSERLRAWIGADGWSEVAVDASCRILRANRRALALLGVAVPGAGLRPGATLPPSLARSLGQAAARGAAARVLEADGRRVALRAIPAIGERGFLLFVIELPASAPRSASTLSRRERDVLDWVAAGKTDAQVALILGISVRTVQKHLEHVYVKLGVEGRTAAAMRVRAGVH